MRSSGRVARLLKRVPTLRGLLHTSLHSPVGHAVRVHVLVGDCHVIVRGQVVSNTLSVAHWAVLVAHQKGP